MLARCWPFDRLQITDEDRTRTRMYLENTRRERAKAESLTYAEFLEKLAVEVELPPAAVGVPGVAPVSGAQASARGFEYRLHTVAGGSEPVFIPFVDAATVPESLLARS